MQKALLIVPCYNEEQRLNISAFQQYTDRYVFLFVNDGSTDGTAALIAKHTNDRTLLLDLKQNQGKAEAVRQGFLHAMNLPIAEQTDWIGFWDADLATPLSEIDNFFKFKDDFSPDAEVIMGSRVKRKGSTVERELGRHLLGRFFATVVDNMFKLGCYDTQCGAKIFRKELVPLFASEPYISSWAFDVELLLRIKDRNIVEYPLVNWKDVAGSKLKVSRIAFKILRDLLKMKRKYAS